MSSIITIPHSSLRTPAKAITVVDRKLRGLIDDLGQTLTHTRNPKGVGLAAPQIDVGVRLFATRVPDEKEKQHPPQIFLNPRIIHHTADKSLGGPSDDPFLEGCLSIPDIFGPVWRWTKIALEHDVIQDEVLVPTVTEFADFAARVVQHELDHLDGVLFIDYVLNSGLPIYQGKNRGRDLQELPPDMVQALLTQSKSL